MSSGLYQIRDKNLDTTLDLTRLKPYGDTMNDGKVQTSFTLPVKDDDKGAAAAVMLAQKMGLADPNVALRQKLDENFTFYVVYGSLTHSINYNEIDLGEDQPLLRHVDDAAVGDDVVDALYSGEGQGTPADHLRGAVLGHQLHGHNDLPGAVAQIDRSIQFVQCIATPLYKNGKPVLALSISFPTFRYTEEKNEKLKKLLLDAKMSLELII